MIDSDVLIYIGYLIGSFSLGWMIGFKFLMIRKMFEQM